MTNGSDRLDRIEQLVEALGQRVDGIAVAVQTNTEQVTFLNNALLQSANAQLQLGQAIENQKGEYQGFMIKTDAVLARLDTTLTSINTALEQQGKILDYLVQRDGLNGKTE